MDGEMIQRLAAARTEELPGTGVSWPFGPDWDVFKVRDRLFMLPTRTTGEPIVILKAWPADGAALCEAYQEITPGYHMNKKHWITLNPGEKIDAQLIEDLVTESYLLVLEQNVPKNRWPVDPSTFGKGRGQ